MERNKVYKFLDSNDIEIVQLGVSLLIEQGVERPEIEELLAPTRFILFISNENGLVVRKKVGGELYEQLKTGNYKVINKFSKEYIAQIFQEVFYNR